MNDLHRVIQRFVRAFLARANPPPRTLEAKPPVVRLPKTIPQAKKKLIDQSAWYSTAHKKRVTERHDYRNVHPDIRRFAIALQKALDDAKMPFVPHQFVRTGQEQDALKAKGVSKASAGKSPHNWGLAFDMIHFTRGWDLTRKEWQVVGNIGKETARKLNLKVDWGGEWDFYDPAHWQLAKWRDQIAQPPSRSPNLPSWYADQYREWKAYVAAQRALGYRWHR